ncbi:MAG: HAMP domain-containing histidine kinase [Lentisphaerae bacterium]|nr:HAMP domain-containing histidine kinase [Lentisphaerota bacterium]
MRTKWFLIALVLVVLPAAILSMLAARTIGYYEVIMRAQLRQDADRGLATVDTDVHDKMLRTLEVIRITLAGTVEPGEAPDRLAAVAQRLEREQPAATRILVFMNPWGFLPDHGPVPGKDDDDEPLEGVLLASVLRTAIASSSGASEPLFFFHEGMSYYFARMPGTASIWAGYAADGHALATVVRRSLDEHAAEGMVFSYAGDWLAGVGEEVSDVVVSDSLSPPGAGIDRANPRGIPGLPVLASRYMMSPLQRIEILVQAAPGVEIRRVATAKTRLYGWGVTLVAVWVLIGIAVVLRQTVVEIHQARQRGEFLLGVSHDLRTPLASMRMLAESLAHGNVREKEQPRFLETIVSECDRLSRLIERVLYLVRYGQGALVYCHREIDMGEVAQRAVTELKAYAGSLQLRVDPDLPHVQGDRAALDQVVLNLLDNAVKYGQKEAPSESAASGSPPAGRVEVTVEPIERARWPWSRRTRWVRLRVRDFGMGIEKSEQRKIFRRFYRSARAHDRNVSGVGLGLALCRHVVHSHGGWIEVESEIGQGTTFGLYLKVG